MDDFTLCTQHCALSGAATTQFTVRPTQLCSRTCLEEDPHGMGIYFPPEGRSSPRLKGIQQQQCLHRWQVQHCTQPLVGRERGRIVLKVRVPGHSSGSNQQFSLSESVHAR